jgi:serine protease Do
MRYKLFPVIITAALTSVMTLFAVSHFQHNTPYFAASSSKAVPVNYVAYNGNTTAGSGAINFELAADASVKAVVHVKTCSASGSIIYHHSRAQVQASSYHLMDTLLPTTTLWQMQAK